MNTFPRSTCRWSRAAGALGLAVVVLAFVCAPQAPKAADGARDVPPFLEDFNARKEPAIVTRDVTFHSAGGPVRGFWARQEVKEPLPGEFRYLSAGQILFTYLHLAPLPELTQALLSAEVTAIAYETIEDPAGNLPILRPMSEDGQ